MFLGIDVGTQSVKALLYDAHSRHVVDLHSAPLTLASTADGSREQLAQWWLTALEQCLKQFCARDKNAVKGIGVSGQQHGFVPLAADGQVLAPVKLWCDTATDVQCAEITENFGGRDHCIAEVGNAILPGYTASKIRWLKQHRPEDYARLATILLPHDYINFYLTGERVMECGDASGTGLLDIRRRQWHSGMLSAVDEDHDLSTKLPPLAKPGTVIGQLRAQVATQLGLPAGTPVATGGGDNMMAAIGTGSVSHSRLTISLGTSGTLFASTDQAVIDTDGALAAFCSSSGGWLPLLCTMNCTVSTELTRRILNVDLEQMEARSAAIPPGSAGVMTLPFFNGERYPNLPRGKGSILGLDEDNYSPDHLLRSAMESAVYGLRAGLDALARCGHTCETVRVTGGGAASGVWRQIVADCFDLPVTVQKVDEGAALGAALQALWTYLQAQGDQTQLQALVDTHLAMDPQRCATPDPQAVSVYKDYYQKYLRHVDLVTPFYTD
ncbi:MAG: xylulokinase [Halioglobus sp.]